MKCLIVSVIFLFSASNFYSQKLCSILSLVNDNSVFVASNLDAPNPNSKMWIVPAKPNQYARVCFGFDKEFRIAENGINEYGLFIDVNSVDKTNWQPSPDKPDWEEWEGWYVTGVPDGILAKCKTVDEAVEIFKKYNLLTFANVKYLIADALGKSVVLEWSKDGLQIIPKDTYYQVSTNFITSDYEPENYPCYRYKTAMNILMKESNITPFETLRHSLSAMAMEYNSPTQYSIIADLKSLKFTLYLFHNFEEPVEFDFNELIKKGDEKYILADFFRNKSYAHKIYTDYYAMQSK